MIAGNTPMQPQAAIPQGLQSLMEATSVLKTLSQQASPVTRDGTPTLASQVANALQSQVQPQMSGVQTPANPQMQPQTPGTAAQAAQAAGIAGQQQQAQQQQAMQAAMQMAQQQQAQPQGMASGGIARLPAHNMTRMENYAQGGVIGFSGEERSDVPEVDGEEAKKKDTRGILKALTATLGAPIAAAIDVATLPINTIRKYSLPGVSKGTESLTPAFDVVRRIIADKTQKTGEAPVAATPAAPKDIGRPPESLTPQQIEAAVRTAPATPRPSAGPGVATSRPSAVPGTSTASSGPQGIMELITGAKAPDITAAVRSARGLLPDTAITNQENLIKQLQDALNKQPPTRAEELNALEDIQRRRLEARKQQAGEEGIDRFMKTMLGLGQGGLGGAGAAGMAFTEKQRAQTAAQLAEDEAYAQKKSAITEAQNNQKINALSSIIDKSGATVTARGQLNTAVSSLASHIASTQGSLTGHQISAMAQIYSTNVNAETQRLLRATQAEANQLARYESVLRANTHDYATVSKDIEAQLEKKYGVYSSLFQNPEMMKKPENVEIYNKYLKDKSDMMRERLDPINQNIARLRTRIEGSGTGYGPPPPGAVKPMGKG